MPGMDNTRPGHVLPKSVLRTVEAAWDYVNLVNVPTAHFTFADLWQAVEVLSDLVDAPKVASDSKRELAQRVVYLADMAGLEDPLTPEDAA